MATNRRLYYPVKQVGFCPVGTSGYVAAHGVQSTSITTNFNLEQVFELSELSIYENIENIPDVEISMEKVLDGYCPLYLMATSGAGASTIAGRSTIDCMVAMSFFSDQNSAASGAQVGEVVISGAVISNASYTFPAEGNATESVTLVANNKEWERDGGDTDWKFAGQFDNTDQPISITSSGGVSRREDFLFDDYDVGSPGTDTNGQVNTTRASILPTELPGISSSGTNDATGPGGSRGAHIQSVSCSVDFGREDIFELGRKTQYFRFATFPVEVTCDIEAIATSGDLISGTELGGQNGAEAGSNLKNQTIKIRTREGLFINLGTSNKLSSVTQSGGDATGGNETTTFSYTNFNDFDVQHARDVTSALVLAPI